MAPVNVRNWLAVHQWSILRLSREAKISYPTLRQHVTDNKAVSDKTAKKLEAWSRKQAWITQHLTAVAILGLDQPAAPDPGPAPAGPAEPRKGARRGRKAA